MSEQNESAITLVSSTTGASMQAAAGTEKVLYTCPSGKEFIPLMVICREFSAGCPTLVATFGVSGGSCDEFLADQTFTNADGTTKYVVLYSDQGTSQQPEGGTILTAGDEFAMEVTTQDVDGGTATIDVFGYLYDA